MLCAALFAVFNLTMMQGAHFHADAHERECMPCLYGNESSQDLGEPDESVLPEFSSATHIDRAVACATCRTHYSVHSRAPPTLS